MTSIAPDHGQGLPSARAATRGEPAETSFGAGGLEPYDNALLNHTGVLYLHENAEGSGDLRALADAAQIDIDRFLSPADASDVHALATVRGPVLDIGCGPGRMVKAAIMAGHLTLGIDVSATAVGIARDQGLPVLRRSVFDSIPNEGTWGTAMLIDGNIGIGGEPRALLARCRELIRVGGEGRILVETHSDKHRDRIFEGVLTDEHSQHSLPFPWAEVGSEALRDHAEAVGLRFVREWSHEGRGFSEYASV